MMHEAVMLFARMCVVIFAAHAGGLLFRLLRLPSVVGEIFAGIFLGPSALGLLFPGLLPALFPASSMPALAQLSQAGVLLYMFTVGAGFETSPTSAKPRTLSFLAGGSLFLAFLLGTGLGLLIEPRFSGANASTLSFSLFLGLALSVTAFPVLTRILEERGELHSELGRTAVACAAWKDIASWALLALVAMLACANDPTSAFKGIGIPSIFAAFFLGWRLPQKLRPSPAWLARTDQFAKALLMPAFFAYTGLRTEIGLLSGADDLWIATVICAAAVAASLGGTASVARGLGFAWPKALRLGILMNTRGMVELIVLNAGLDLGVIDRKLFSILVLMALATTMMTGPLLSLMERLERKSSPAAELT